ncbi:MAG: helix-turn-helix domain-containing protein [Gemmatimonadaceae bacterium]
MRTRGDRHCFTAHKIPGRILLNVKQQLVEVHVARGFSLAGIDLRSNTPQSITTQQFDWPGVRLEAGTNNIAAINELAGSHHYLSLNVDDRPVTLEVKGQLGDFRRVVLRRGAAWFCPAGDVISARVNNDYRYMRMSIDPLYFDRLVASEPDARPLQLRRSYGIVEPQITHILSALVAESDAGNPGGVAFVEALTSGMSQQLALHAGVRAPIQPRLRGGLSTATKRRALELMDSHLGASVSVEFLAAEVALSPAHFARAFRETFGLPPHRYLLHLRLERARRLLDGEDASLSDVAQRAGFADQAHFTRLFKREYGVTPGIVVRSRRGLTSAR